jgi:hypothetical protein
LVGLKGASVPTGAQLEVHAFLGLEMSEDAEQVFCRRVPVGPEHAHEAVGGDRGCLLKLPETKGGDSLD